jgi:hypothetical protein
MRADRRHPACVFVISVGLLAIFTLSLGLTSSAQRTAQGPVITTTARNAALVAATQEVLKETSEIRQLSIMNPVPSSTQSRAEIERMLIKNLNEETTPAQIHATEVTLKKLGLVPGDFQYRALMIRLLTEQVAGYYDPKMREFHLADWIDLDAQKPVIAHELTHALQDQHFNLRRFEHWPKGDSDAELAAHALIEGDATLAMSFYVLKNPLRALAFLRSLGGAGMKSEELDKAPRALRETLLFPYQEGLMWTRRLYGQGGWEQVSKAFTELPQSTEQVLHPEKYFAREAPVKYNLPDLTPLLNGRRQRAAGRPAGSADVPYPLSAQRESVWTPATLAGSAGILPALRVQQLTAHRSLPAVGWRRLDSDVNGEWGFYLILDQFLKSPAESRRAAAGWDGDRYAVYESPKGEVLIASLSTWDTEDDAREFFDAYVKRTELRYPRAERLASARSSVPGSGPVTQVSWRTSEGMVVIELRRSRVLALEGSYGPVSERMLIRSLWQ